MVWFISELSLNVAANSNYQFILCVFFIKSQRDEGRKLRSEEYFFIAVCDVLKG